MPGGWLGRVNAFCDQFMPILEEMLKLLTRNKIFMDRTVGIGVVSREDALAYGLTGPNLRHTPETILASTLLLSTRVFPGGRGTRRKPSIVTRLG